MQKSNEYTLHCIFLFTKKQKVMSGVLRYLSKKADYYHTDEETQNLSYFGQIWAPHELNSRKHLEDKTESMSLYSNK